LLESHSLKPKFHWKKRLPLPVCVICHVGNLYFTDVLYFPNGTGVRELAEIHSLWNPTVGQEKMQTMQWLIFTGRGHCLEFDTVGE